MRPIGVGRRGPRGPRPARFFAEMCILHSKMTVETALSSAKCTSRRQGALTAGRGRRERRPRRPRRRTGGAIRAARTSPDSRDRRATRENAPPADVLAGCPAISRVKVRSRRLPGDLADPTGAGWDGAGTRAGPATIPARSRPIPGPARSASGRGRAGGRRRRRDPGQKSRGNRHHAKDSALSPRHRRPKRASPQARIRRSRGFSTHRWSPMASSTPIMKTAHHVKGVRTGSQAMAPILASTA